MNVSKLAIILMGALLLPGLGYAQKTQAGTQLSAAKKSSSLTKEGALLIADLYKFETPSNQMVLEQISANQDVLATDASYAGTWVDYDKDNNAYQVVAATRSINIPKSLQKNGQIRIVIVNNSLAHLNEVKDALKEFMESQGGEPIILSLSIEVKINKVSARIRREREQELNSIIVAKGIDMAALSIEYQDGPSELYRNLTGGQKIITKNPGSNFGCTSGFNAHWDQYRFIITAGHCAINRNTVYFDYAATGNWNSQGVLIGSLLGGYYNPSDRMDLATFGNTNSAHTQPPLIIRDTVLSAVYHPLTVPIGGTVCTQGGMKGWRCGVVASTSALHSVPNPSGGYFSIEFSEATFCGTGGDSGGPVVSANGNAVGIYSGSVGYYPDGNCSGFGGGSGTKSIYQSLAPFLSRFPGVVVNRVD